MCRHSQHIDENTNADVEEYTHNEIPFTTRWFHQHISKYALTMEHFQYHGSYSAKDNNNTFAQ